MKQAKEAAGFRERYAMDHGRKIEFFWHEKRYWKFLYGSKDPYQDANGATYCVTEGRWVG